MSEQLRAFFKAYLEWAETGASEEQCVLYKCAGLCSNLTWYLNHNYPDDWAGTSRAEKQLADLFAEGGLDSDYPFGSSYWKESNTKSHHLNPKRIAWVRKQLEK